MSHFRQDNLTQKEKFQAMTILCGLGFVCVFIFWIFFMTTVSPGYVGVVVNMLGENTVF